MTRRAKPGNSSSVCVSRATPPRPTTSRIICTLHGAERGLLFTLREACETILTAIEAIDPVTQTMIEELRVEVEKRLRPPDEDKPA